MLGQPFVAHVLWEQCEGFGVAEGHRVIMALFRHFKDLLDDPPRGMPIVDPLLTAVLATGRKVNDAVIGVVVAGGIAAPQLAEPIAVWQWRGTVASNASRDRGVRSSPLAS